MARPKAPTSDTRQRILAAAAGEFGDHGFAATTIDRIARRARVNKAMIYYHFSNKRALYTSIIRDVFRPITERTRAVIADDLPADRKLDRVIETIVASLDESAHFLPIFLREIADGGAHLGPDELALIAGMFAAVSGVIAEGGRQKVFQPVASRTGALYDHRAARDVPCGRSRPRPDQKRTARRYSRSRLRHAGPASANGGKAHAESGGLARQDPGVRESAKRGL